MLWHLEEDTYELGVPPGWSPGVHFAKEAVWPAFSPKGSQHQYVGLQKKRKKQNLHQVKMRNVL